MPQLETLNPWGIHCVECTIDAPCELCMGQIEAEFGYKAGLGSHITRERLQRGDVRRSS